VAAVAVAGANDRDIVAIPGGSDALVAAPAGLLLRAADGQLSVSGFDYETSFHPTTTAVSVGEPGEIWSPAAYSRTSSNPCGATSPGISTGSGATRPKVRGAAPPFAATMLAGQDSARRARP
jgi:hypothetical protein